MIALTILPPWPFAIRTLGKDVENRRWTPPRALLRPGEWLALHGGAVPATLAKRREAWELALELIRKHVADLDEQDRLEARFSEERGTLWVQGIFAVVRYTGAVSSSDSPWFEGPWGWTWDEIVHLPEPVPCRGKQKLWLVPAETLKLVRSQYRKAVA